MWPRRALLIVGLVAASWYAMMTVHECGHVVGAMVTGGRVARVSVPVLGFSRTDMAANPHPLIVAAAGPVFGAVVPVCAYGLMRFLKARGVLVAAFFAGFCAVVNGAYVAAGAMMRVGDAEDLVRQGAPGWVLVGAGLVAAGVGLWVWHQMGPRFGLGNRAAGCGRSA